MIYNYKITTSIGYAEGTIEADSENDAKSILTDNHSGKFTDVNDKVKENQVIDVELTIAV